MIATITTAPSTRARCSRVRRSIQIAADSFERLDLPRPHIRDYLEHLYSLQDWDRMAELVQSLRLAVLRFLSSDGQKG